VLTTPVEVAGGTMLAQVLSDRSAEVRTLESLLLVLLVAVPLAAVAAGLAGWVYSGCALVPIRRAMARQRQFAADASHELRTPLAVLSGNLELLARTAGTGAIDDEALADAMAETERMAALLDDLLTWRGPTPKPSLWHWSRSISPMRRPRPWTAWPGALLRVP
jgi:signal transduction histidine kinase